MRPLKVFPNPWGVHPSPAAGDKTVRRVLDHYGRPCLTVPRLDNPISGIGVGARISRAKMQDAHSLGGLKESTPLASPPQEVVWEFLGIEATDDKLAEKLAEAEPVEVPFHKFYLSALKSADLLPADAYTATLAGYKFDPKSFPNLAAKATAGIDKDFLETPELTHEAPKAAPVPAPQVSVGSGKGSSNKGGDK